MGKTVIENQIIEKVPETHFDQLVRELYLVMIKTLAVIRTLRDIDYRPLFISLFVLTLFCLDSIARAQEIEIIREEDGGYSVVLHDDNLLELNLNELEMFEVPAGWEIADPAQATQVISQYGGLNSWGGLAHRGDHVITSSDPNFASIVADHFFSRAQELADSADIELSELHLDVILNNGATDDDGLTSYVDQTGNFEVLRTIQQRAAEKDLNFSFSLNYRIPAEWDTDRVIAEIEFLEQSNWQRAVAIRDLIRMGGVLSFDFELPVLESGQSINISELNGVLASVNGLYEVLGRSDSTVLIYDMNASMFNFDTRLPVDTAVIWKDMSIYIGPNTDYLEGIMQYNLARYVELINPDHGVNAVWLMLFTDDGHLMSGQTSNPVINTKLTEAFLKYPHIAGLGLQ